MAASGVFAHDADRGNTGENLYKKTSNGDLNIVGGEASMAWYSEIDDYDFATGQGNGNEAIGHFTQEVWKASTKVGFGRA